jgi:hypothetical protein
MSNNKKPPAFDIYEIFKDVKGLTRATEKPPTASNDDDGWGRETMFLHPRFDPDD